MASLRSQWTHSGNTESGGTAGQNAITTRLLWLIHGGRGTNEYLITVSLAFWLGVSAFCIPRELQTSLRWSSSNPSWFLCVTSSPVFLIANARSEARPAASAIAPIIDLILASAAIEARQNQHRKQNHLLGPGSRLVSSLIRLRDSRMGSEHRHSIDPFRVATLLVPQRMDHQSFWTVMGSTRALVLLSRFQSWFAV